MPKDATLPLAPLKLFFVSAGSERPDHTRPVVRMTKNLETEFWSKRLTNVIYIYIFILLNLKPFKYFFFKNLNPYLI